MSSAVGMRTKQTGDVRCVIFLSNAFLLSFIYFIVPCIRNFFFYKVLASLQNEKTATSTMDECQSRQDGI